MGLDFEILSSSLDFQLGVEISSYKSKSSVISQDLQSSVEIPCYKSRSPVKNRDIQL